jgi:hypothetical protein
VVKKTAPRRVRHRRHRVRRAKPAAKTAPVAMRAPAKPVAAKPTSSASAPDSLIGHYVALKLKSGREVKGVLRERTAQGVSLEIPGMGPFQYPNSNIDGIKAAD